MPGREPRWRGRLRGVPGLLVAEHPFLLAATPGGTRFTRGERFRGALPWGFDPGTLMPAFEAVDAALAARAVRRVAPHARRAAPGAG